MCDWLVTGGNQTANCDRTPTSQGMAPDFPKQARAIGGGLRRRGSIQVKWIKPYPGQGGKGSGGGIYPVRPEPHCPEFSERPNSPESPENPENPPHPTHVPLCPTGQEEWVGSSIVTRSTGSSRGGRKKTERAV